MLLAQFLRPLIHIGQLTVIDADGRHHLFGYDMQPAVTIRLHDRSLHWKLFFRPEVSAGEAYMAGTLTVENGTIYDLLDLIGRNAAASGRDPFAGNLQRLDRLFRRWQQLNRVNRARHNAAYHYDLNGAFYDLFLDADRQYSCACFDNGNETLDEAQRRKRRRIAAKLLLRPGMRVLDIGSGWGGLALYLADRLGVHVTGVTLAEEQLKVARARAAQCGLADHAQFFLRDYREEKGTYHRIVSVGMFEHVGVRHYRTFFDVICQRLTDDGVALLHTIGRTDGPGTTNPWIRKYIFPGGYSPALSEILPVIERSGLRITDIEVWRLHYAETLRRWRGRFLANRDRAKALYGEEFCRMWEFYLAGSEMAFRWLGLVIFQIQLAKRQETVPLLRDYMVDIERDLARNERDHADRAA